MKAKIEKVGCNININHRREDSFYKEYITINRNGGIVSRLKLYHTGARIYACLWVFGGGEFYTAGSGYAGGYGYDRTSAAAQEAIQNAGFTLSKNIAGVGDCAIQEALQAIAATQGYRKVNIVVANA